MGLTRDQVIETLRWRYDFYSSRAVAGDLIEAISGDYDAAELDDGQARALYERLVADPLNAAAAAHLRPLLGIPEPKASEEADAGGDDARKKAEEDARKKAEVDARKKAEEDARKKAEVDARKKAEEDARKKAEEDARKKAEEDARKKAEEDARKKAEEDARKKAEEDARKKAEEDARKKAEEDAKKKAREADGTVELSITLTGAPKGKHVVVVGNLDELGGWKPAKGLELSETKGSWSGKLTAPVGTELEYKFVSIDGDDETWEGGKNRKLIATAGEGELKLTWQS